MGYISEEENYLWDEAYEWAYQRAREEGDVDIDHDEDLIDAWAAEYYEDLKIATTEGTLDEVYKHRLIPKKNRK